MDSKKKIELQIIANKIRLNALTGIFNASSGHPGGSLSIADLLAYLYFEEMNVKPENPAWEDRDRFVLSKGHTAPALYSVLGLKGYFDVAEVATLRKFGSRMQGHPDMKGVPGVDMSTGSLGQGTSVAGGMALNAKLLNKDYRVYSILGDGECEEGQVWEAAMFAAHYKLDNLVTIVDFNGLQIDGNITDVMSPCPIDEKFKAFGFNVILIDAHNYDEIEAAFKKARETKGQPTAIIAKSIKGKGVSFMENEAGWHGAAPNQEQFDIAVSELKESIKELEGRLNG
ncbi:MAG: transketolase [Clostridia bacterium]|nr:transketolase [Clostridia bacterium]